MLKRYRHHVNIIGGTIKKIIKNGSTIDKIKGTIYKNEGTIYESEGTINKIGGTIYESNDS